jgi:uncharacterized damage-inducible protein DinB
MITPAFVVTLARYNRWQNESLYNAAATLDESARRRDRGAFFKSIHGTLAHVLWGDRVWMHRFAGTPKPEGGIATSDGHEMAWAALSEERTAFDGVILAWASDLGEADLAGNLSWYSGALEKDVTASRGLLITHMFNHQTHHRGQVHAMLTAAGARPDDTDLMKLATWD